MFEVIPAIDLLDNKVVRLTQGDYGIVDTYNTFTPAEWAKQFESHGAKRIHIVDLNGAKEGKSINLKAIKEIRKAVSCKIEVGGGIRSLANINMMLEEGVDWVIIGSLLVKQFPLAAEMITTFPDRMIAGLDANGMALAIEGWIEKSEISVFEIIDALNDLPLNSIIYTDISKDGTLEGPNLEALEKIAAKTDCPIIASGGVGTIEDIEKIRALKDLGITGCIVGKAILSGKIPLSQIKF